MIWNAESLYLSFDMICEYNDTWFIKDMHNNELYIYDYEKKKVQMKHKFEKEEEYKYLLFSKMVIFENKLYMIPYSAKYLYILDLESNNEKVVNITISPVYPKLIYDKDKKFISGYVFERKLYLLGGSFPGIAIYDIDLGVMSVYTDWIEKVNQWVGNEIIYFRKTQMNKNYILAPLCGGPAILQFDMRNYKSSIIPIDCEDGFSAICKYEDGFLLLPRNNGPIIFWKENGQQRRIAEIPIYDIKKQAAYEGIIVYNNYLVVTPLAINGIWSIDLRDGRIRKILDGNYAFCFICKNKLFIVTSQDGCINIFDENLVFKDSFQISYPKEKYSYHSRIYNWSYKYLSGQWTYKNEILHEEYNEALSEFISFVEKR